MLLLRCGGGGTSSQPSSTTANVPTATENKTTVTSLAALDIDLSAVSVPDDSVISLYALDSRITAFGKSKGNKVLFETPLKDGVYIVEVALSEKEVISGSLMITGGKTESILQPSTQTDFAVRLAKTLADKTVGFYDAYKKALAIASANAALAKSADQELTEAVQNDEDFETFLQSTVALKKIMEQYYGE